MSRDLTPRNIRLSDAVRLNGIARLNKVARLNGFARLAKKQPSRWCGAELLEDRNSPGSLLPLTEVMGLTGVGAMSPAAFNEDVLKTEPIRYASWQPSIYTAAVATTAPLAATPQADQETIQVSGSVTSGGLVGEGMLTAQTQGHNALDAWDLPSAMESAPLAGDSGLGAASAALASIGGAAQTHAAQTQAGQTQTGQTQQTASTVGLHPLAEGSSGASATLDFATSTPIATEGDTPELAAAISGLQTTSARQSAYLRAIDATEYDNQTKVALKFAASVGVQIDLQDAGGAQAWLDELFGLLSRGAASERFDYLQTFDKLFNQPKPDFTEVTSIWLLENPTVSGSTSSFAMAAASGSGSSTGPINNCANPDVSCADLDIVTNSPGAQDGYEANLGSLISVNWDDDNQNGRADNKEYGGFADPAVVVLTVSGLGRNAQTFSRVGTLTFDTDIFRVWRNSTRTLDVISASNTQGNVATTINLGDYLYVECIAPRITHSTAIVLQGDLSSIDTVSLFPVNALFLKGQYSATNANPLPAYPEVLFAQADYATPLSFDIAGLPALNNVNGATIHSIKSYMLESNESKTRFTPLLSQPDTTSSRFVNGRNGDSLTKNNGQSTDYTVFMRSSKIKTVDLGANRDWTTRAYFALKVLFSYGVYPQQWVLTNVDATVANTINFYDNRVNAIDVSYSATNPTYKVLNVQSESRSAYFLSHGTNTPQIPASTLSLYFSSVFSDYTLDAANKVTAIARLGDSSTRFAANRQPGRLVSTYSMGGQVYVSYGGRFVPLALGENEQAMDYRLNSGHINMQLFPLGRYELAAKDAAQNVATPTTLSPLFASFDLLGTVLSVSKNPYVYAAGVSLSVGASLGNLAQTLMPSPQYVNNYWGGVASISANNWIVHGRTDNHFETQSLPGSGGSTSSSGSLSLAFTQSNVSVGSAVARNVSLVSIADGVDKTEDTQANVEITALASYITNDAQDMLTFKVWANA